MKYRAEVDGLRAIAVLPVILFHAGLEAFSGGFVGVDVFFVISGYLITSIILEDMEKGKFSLLKFYDRRARRILPALFLVVFFCFPLAWYGLLPKPFVDFAESVIAVSAFVSNFLFWTEADYFDTAVELKPLLHTWSLAVEEQYYVIFPLLMMALWRFGTRAILITLAAIAVTSMIASLFLSGTDASANFYLLITRAWEILIGAFCAFYLRTDHQVENNALRQALAGLGLAAIVTSIFMFDKNTTFPGPAALVPTLGVALIIIFATGETWVAKLLSLRAMVTVGLISYSAYLWHQPLIAFAKIRVLGHLSYPTVAAIVALTLFLASLSYWFVEKPFRRGSVSGKALIVSIVCALALSNGAAAYIIQGKGFANRLQSVFPFEARVREENLYKSFVTDTMNDKTPAQPNLPIVLVLGDSYVRSWSVGLSSVIDQTKHRVVSISYLGCKVTPKKQGWGFDVSSSTKRYDANCTPFAEYINNRDLLKKVKHIFLVSHRPFEYAPNQFRFELLNTLMNELKQAQLYVMGDYFQLKFPENSSCLNVMFNKKSDASACLEMAVFPPAGFDFRKRAFSDRLKVPYHYIDITKLLCGDDGKNCPYEADGVPFMQDWNHLSASFLIKYLPEMIEKRVDYLRTVGLTDVFKAQ